MIEDRGNAVGAMRSSTSCGMVMRSSASLASSPLSIVTAVQRRPESLRAIAVNTCVPIGLSGLRIVTGTSMVASDVKLMRRTADEDRRRLERELRLASRLGGVGLPRRGHLGGVLCGGGGV